MINNSTNNSTNNIPVAGTDFFADSETFLNELTDSELVQVRGGLNAGVNADKGKANIQVDVDTPSELSLLLCN